MSEVTQILQQIESGDPSAAEHLLPLVYEELRKLAAARMAHESPNNTLQATALVHEAYVRLVNEQTVQRWNSRGHFFAAAAEAMRRILMESARRKRNLKHGGDRDRVPLSNPMDPRDEATWDLIDLNEALMRFEALDPEKARLIKLRFFAGLSVADAAEALDISPATAKRHWTSARAWLFGEINGRERSGIS